MRELLLANEGFRRAYELWERAPDPEVSYERRLLDEAQDRLDFARERVSEVESSLRRSDRRH
ncbi:MAG TPA: hypothetical protein VHH36_08180 [Candidatus Thermoplasmatota archaeon]|nr:hypothetical protein [Candidatus Thermoplasmatota archaeon]